MAASGGGVVPAPPKRPTIIRQTNNSDIGVSPVPARPAPPVPGVRPQPSVPGRPSDVGPSRPHPPTPDRPSESARPKSLVVAASRPQDKPASVRKRPEITIVCARPMSEVDFRDQKSSALAKPPETNGHIKSAPSQSLPQPSSPRPVARLHEDEIDSIQKSTSVPLRGPPPTVPRPTVIKPTGPSSVPARGAPPVPGRPSISPRSANVDSLETSPASSHMPVGEPPTVPNHPNIDSAQSSHSFNMTPNADSPPLPRGPPPPIPRNPSVQTRPPPPKVSPRSNTAITETEHRGLPFVATADIDDSHNTSDSNVNSEDKLDARELYAVITKPKRPTIIRPGRPSVKSDSQKDSEVEHKADSNDGTTTKPNPVLPKRNYEEETSESNIQDRFQTRKSSIKMNENLNSNAMPEFFKLKLKPTVVDNDVSDTDKHRATAGRGSEGSELTKHSSMRGPPPDTKPKPSVLPKPKIAAKPSVAAKPSTPAKPSAPAVSKVGVDTEIKDVGNAVNKMPEIQAFSTTNSDTLESVKPVSVKRPTIIRPTRPTQSSSSENIGQTVAADTNKMYNEDRRTVDDNSVGAPSHPQLPLPSKRPVSMVNIPQAFAQEEETESQSISTSKSLNFSNASQPRPSPRPAARARPASMAVTSGTSGLKPPLPSDGPKLESSNQSFPPRPQHRPSQKTSPSALSPLEHKKDEHSDSENSSGQQRAYIDNKAPSKPVRRPPPPNISPQKGASSSDEEFVTAQVKPDRPAGRPSPPHFSPGNEAEKKPPRPGGPPPPHFSSGDEAEKKPPRPGGPPPPRKASLQDKPDQDEEPAKLRPAKPDTPPSRPMSTPVKATQPPRPGAPTPGKKKKDVPKLPSRPGPGHPLYHYMMQAAHGIALFDYTAQHADELSFKLGEVILLVRSVDTDWFVGKVGGTEGMFPRSFVKVKIPLPGETVEDDSSSNDSAEMFYDASADKPDHLGYGPRCRARFDFDGEGPDDLVFEEGDVIRLLERAGLEWRKGECGGRTGLFPLTYVEMIEDLPEDGADETTNTEVKALFDFEGEDGELVFQAHDSIHVQYRVNEEWLYGSIDDRAGRFPIQFVDHVPLNLPPLPSDETVTTATGGAVSQMSMWSRPDSVNKPSSPVARHTPGEETPYCIALYDYPGEAADDLIFNEGDRIDLLERISADWLKGKLGRKTGMFPSAFVEVKVGITATNEVPSPGHSDIFGVALHEFTGEADNELTFVTGDRIALHELVDGAEDWRWGVFHGQRGMFPSAFVQEER